MNYLQKKKLAFMSIVNQIKGFIRTISGAFPLTLTDCVDNKSITNYSIHGNSMQDGVPTPDAPIEVESVGEYDESIGKYKIPITVSGKNLFDKSDYQVDVQGAIGFSIRHLKIGTKYTISSNKPLTWVKISLASSGYNSVQFANESGFYKYSFTMQRHSNISENETQYLFLGSTVGERTFVNNISQLDGFDIQIEEGSTTTDYEPYHESISTNIYLDEPLRKVGDYADYIDFENNEIVRNIGKYTFTGDERDWGGAVGYTGSFGYTVNISDLSLTVHKVGLCNHLTQSGFAGSVNRFAFHDAANHPYCYIFFLEKDFPDLGTYSPETAKQIVKQMYDSGEPLILYYNTNTPTKEFVELPIIPTFKGTSIISVDTTIQPSNAEIEYYSNAKER